MAAKATQLFKDPPTPLSAHAFNADRSLIAVSPNDETVRIVSMADCEVKHQLGEHSQHVTAIDWAPKTNAIVTCGQDRNAYVWKLKDGVWKPELVILRINRAATCVKWSPKEDKFAIGSGSRLISVCYHEEDHDWWVSKHIKKPIRSTVLCVDWHPNNVLLAAGSSDFKARVFSGYIKSVDEKPGPTVWGKKMPFGEPMAEFGTGEAGGGWVHAVSFSASGDKLVFAAHDSSVTVVDGGNDMCVARFDCKDLPYTSISWVTENSFVAAGHDYVPMLYVHEGASIKNLGKLDVPQQRAAKAMSALQHFQNLDKKGTTTNKTDVESTHQNAIVEMSIYEGDKSAVSKFATIGLDGRVVVWDVKACCSAAGVNLA